MTWTPGNRRFQVTVIIRVFVFRGEKGESGGESGGGSGDRIPSSKSGSISEEEMIAENPEDQSEMEADVAFARRGCCFWMRCLGSEKPARGGSIWWERIGGAAEREDGWWSRGVNSLKKIREWTEIHAGPKWKTFIRQFGRNRSGRHGKFNYDPLSYALNFDEGSRWCGHPDDERGYVDFSSRYASLLPSAAKSSLDLGEDGGAA